MSSVEEINGTLAEGGGRIEAVSVPPTRMRDWEGKFVVPFPAEDVSGPHPVEPGFIYRVTGRGRHKTLERVPCPSCGLAPAKEVKLNASEFCRLFVFVVPDFETWKRFGLNTSGGMKYLNAPECPRCGRGMLVRVDRGKGEFLREFVFVEEVER